MALPSVTPPPEKVEISQRIKDLKDVSIAIDTWDDIFSDFDPRPLKERLLSEDFMNELKKRYRETKKGSYLITIYAPSNLKGPRIENIVTQRIKEHFRHRFLQKKKEKNKLRLRGVFFVSYGILFLSFLMFATYYKWFEELTIQMLSIVLMPLGWFGIWEGFSKIVDTSSPLAQEETLFDKLSKAAYRFYYIEENNSPLNVPSAEEPKKVNEGPAPA